MVLAKSSRVHRAFCGPSPIALGWRWLLLRIDGMKSIAIESGRGKTFESWAFRKTSLRIEYSHFYARAPQGFSHLWSTALAFWWCPFGPWCMEERSDCITRRERRSSRGKTRAGSGPLCDALVAGCESLDHSFSTELVIRSSSGKPKFE
jgi:hypothetical protein